MCDQHFLPIKNEFMPAGFVRFQHLVYLLADHKKRTRRKLYSRFRALCFGNLFYNNSRQPKALRGKSALTWNARLRQFDRVYSLCHVFFQMLNATNWINCSYAINMLNRSDTNNRINNSIVNQCHFGLHWRLHFTRIKFVNFDNVCVLLYHIYLLFSN